MGNTFDRQMSLRKKATDAMSQLEEVKSAIEEIRKGNMDTIMAVNQAFTQLSGKLETAQEIVDAVVGVVGAEAVQQAVIANRLAQMTASADAARKNISDALEAGKLTRTETVTAKSLIVGRELKPDGAEVPPGYAALRFSQVKEAFQAKLLGLKPGASLDTENGGKFEVVELYEDATPPAETVPATATVEGEVVAHQAAAPESAQTPAVQ